MLGGLGSWPRMVSGCGSFLKLLKQEILLWMTHEDPLSGGGWGGQEKKIFLFLSGSRMRGWSYRTHRKCPQDKVPEAEK